LVFFCFYFFYFLLKHNMSSSKGLDYVIMPTGGLMYKLKLIKLQLLPLRRSPLVRTQDPLLVCLLLLKGPLSNLISS